MVPAPDGRGNPAPTVYGPDTWVRPYYRTRADTPGVLYPHPPLWFLPLMGGGNPAPTVYGPDTWVRPYH
jgi:hypothetical protein